MRETQVASNACLVNEKNMNKAQQQEAKIRANKSTKQNAAVPTSNEYYRRVKKLQFQVREFETHQLSLDRQLVLVPITVQSANQ